MCLLISLHDDFLSIPPVLEQWSLCYHDHAHQLADGHTSKDNYRLSQPDYHQWGSEMLTKAYESTQSSADYLRKNYAPFINSKTVRRKQQSQKVGDMLSLFWWCVISQKYIVAEWGWKLNPFFLKIFIRNIVSCQELMSIFTSLTTSIYLLSRK